MSITTGSSKLLSRCRERQDAFNELEKGNDDETSDDITSDGCIGITCGG